MRRVLIPVTDFEAGQRALRRLLDEFPLAGTEVLLVGIAEPLTSGRVAMQLSASRAQAMAASVIGDALSRLGALLDAAGFAYRTELVSGSRRALLAQLARRDDVDVMLLPGGGWRWLDAQEERRMSRLARHPVLVVG